MKRFVIRRLVTAICATGMLGISSQALASAFQLWEQDGASIANYHAGYAALANDASIAWYNPAGITRIKHQELVLGGDIIMSDFKYRGGVGVREQPLPFLPTFTNTFTSVTAQGGTFNVVPDLHYVAPITDRLGFGFSVDAPFGLKTDYGRSTPVQYSSTLSSIRVIDISPSLAFRVTQKGSIGVGFDIQTAHAEFNSVGASLKPISLTEADLIGDTRSSNKANDTGYGYHLGVLYEFTPCTRAGISYHSHVMHHLKGDSKFNGPIADLLNDDTQIVSNNARANVNLPGYTAFSVFNKFTPQFALMGTVIYTQWHSFKNLVLQNVAGAITVPDAPYVVASRNIKVVISEHYRSSWNASIGGDYYITDRVTFRGAIGYDQTPVRNKYRNTQLPDNNRFVVAFGGHFQATKAVGLDLGYFHVFFDKAHISPPPQVTGAQTVITNGNVKGAADVIGTQLTWDIV